MRKAVVLGLLGLLVLYLVLGLGWCVAEAYMMDQYGVAHQGLPSEWGSITWYNVRDRALWAYWPWDMYGLLVRHK